MAENLVKDPIRVVSEQDAPEGDLGDASRINYSRTYTVEKNVRVLNIGMVHANSLPALAANSLVKSQGIQKPLKNPTPSRGAKSTSQSRSRKPPFTPIANQSDASATVKPVMMGFQGIRLGPSEDQFESQEEEVSDTANWIDRLSDRKSTLYHSKAFIN